MQTIIIFLILVLVAITENVTHAVNEDEPNYGKTNETSSTFLKVLKRSPDQDTSRALLTPSIEGPTDNRNTPMLCSYFFGKQCDGDIPITLLSSTVLKVLTQKEP